MGRLVKTPAVALISLLVLIGCEFWGIGVDSPEATYDYRVELELSGSSSSVQTAEVTWLLPDTATEITGETVNGDGEREWGPMAMVLGATESERISSFTGTTDRDWSDLLRLELSVEVNPILAAGEHVAALLRYTDIRLEGEYDYDVACLVFVQAMPASEQELVDICGTPAEVPVVQLLLDNGPQSMSYSVNLPVRR